MRAVVRIWDAPTRLFHWLLVVCVMASIVTANIGGAAMDWHFRLGYSVMSLLLFRLVWGIVGGYWSRFTSFVRNPKAVWTYLSQRSLTEQSVGHNPLGALSVLAMLTILLLQVCTGMLSDDEISASGPLTRFVSGDWVTLATFYHKQIGKILIIFLVATHVSAIAFYYFKKNENLLLPMWSGDKLLSFEAQPTSDTKLDRIKGFLIYLGVATLVISAVYLLE